MRYSAQILAIVSLIGPANAQNTVPVTVRVNPASTYQTIEGWGGSLYPQTLPYFAADPDYGRSLLEDLNVTHVRLRSVWYLLEGTNDNDDPEAIDFDAIARGDTGLVHDEFLLQQRLSRAGVTLQFASWRFPYWMVRQPPTWNPSSDEKPELPVSMDAEYVESIAAYLLYAREEYGFEFDAVSVANEPDIGIYIKGLTPGRLLRLSRMLDERLRLEGYETRFYLPDVAAADSIGMHYASQFLSLDGAASFADALAYHSYRREANVIQYFSEAAAESDLPVWVTEHSHTHLAVDDRFNWSHALANAECLADVLEGNATLILYWSLAMASSGGLGLYIPEEKKWAPAYYMLKHFYNDVPVGSVRMGAVSTGSENLRALAFRHPESDRSTVILINTGREVLNVSLMVAGSMFDFESGVVSQTLSLREDRLPELPIVIPPESVSSLVVRLTGR
jgi:O-glycosyl hydrolase